MDDGEPEMEMRYHQQNDQQEMIGKDLEFGEVKREKKNMSSLLNKINQKKQEREDPTQVEHSILNLGLIKSLH